MSTTKTVTTQVAVVACGKAGQPPCPAEPVLIVPGNPLNPAGGNPGIMPNPESVPAWVKNMDAFLNDLTKGSFRIMFLPVGAKDERVVKILGQATVRVPGKSAGTERTKVREIAKGRRR